MAFRCAKERRSRRATHKQNPERGLPYMTSAKFSDFLPPPPCHCHIHATSVTFVCFSMTPVPLECRRHKWKPQKKGRRKEGRKGHHFTSPVLSFLFSHVWHRPCYVGVGEEIGSVLGRRFRVSLMGKRRKRRVCHPNGFLGLSLNDRTILFLMIFLDKTVSVG